MAPGRRRDEPGAGHSRVSALPPARGNRGAGRAHASLRRWARLRVCARRHARQRRLGGRSHRRVPSPRAGRRGGGHRLARRPAVVHRPGGDDGPLLGRLQRAPGRGPPAARAPRRSSRPARPTTATRTTSTTWAARSFSTTSAGPRRCSPTTRGRRTPPSSATAGARCGSPASAGVASGSTPGSGTSAATPSGGRARCARTFRRSSARSSPSADGSTRTPTRCRGSWRGSPCRAGLIGQWAHRYPHMALPGPAVGLPSARPPMVGHVAQGPHGGGRRRAGAPDLDAGQRPPGGDARDPAGPLDRGARLAVRPHHAAALRAPSRAPRARGRARGRADAPVAGDARPYAGRWCPYQLTPDLPLDQRLEDGGALTFDTDPLPERLEVLGAPVAELALAVDRPVALLAARLSDVAPDGAATRVSYGLLNLTHRESHEHPTALKTAGATGCGSDSTTSRRRSPPATAFAWRSPRRTGPSPGRPRR